MAWAAGDGGLQVELVAARGIAWLVLKVQASVEDSLKTIGRLFDLVPQGDPLEPILAPAAMIVFTTRGKNHPKREELAQRAAQLLSIAAANAGIDDQASFDRWYAENRLADPAHVFPASSLSWSSSSETVGSSTPPL